MHVSIVGAGALGSVYGARLACLGGCEISVVARSEGAPTTVSLEKVDDGNAISWSVPARVSTAPRETDVVLAFVPYEQLESLPARVGHGSAPVVVMTPMMPQDHARLEAALPGRVLTGMPSVASYRNDAGAVRYWLPRVATTFVEARPTESGAVTELVKRLERAEIRAQLAPAVLERNVATTVSFIPLAMGLDAAGSLEALLSDRDLLVRTLAAASEGRALGRAVGKAEAWASMLLRFVTASTLRMGVRMARARAPEAVFYVEHHFGRKLHAQNVAMAERMVDLARTTGVRAEHIAELLVRLRSR